MQADRGTRHLGWGLYVDSGATLPLGALPSSLGRWGTLKLRDVQSLAPADTVGSHSGSQHKSRCHPGWLGRP